MGAAGFEPATSRVRRNLRSQNRLLEGIAEQAGVSSGSGKRTLVASSWPTRSHPRSVDWQRCSCGEKTEWAHDETRLLTERSRLAAFAFHRAPGARRPNECSLGLSTCTTIPAVMRGRPGTDARFLLLRTDTISGASRILLAEASSCVRNIYNGSTARLPHRNARTIKFTATSGRTLPSPLIADEKARSLFVSHYVTL
jgi:hypothetical protein